MNDENENRLQLSLMTVTYADRMRHAAAMFLLPIAAFAGEIYTRDGVTDGDTFYLAPAATTNEDPVYQSWVTFSLIRSTCKLEVGGDNPARNSSFDCEFTARRHLVNAWEEQRTAHAGVADDYLDSLSRVYDAGFLAEYTAHYFGKKHWVLPDDIRKDAFREWRREHLRGHKPRTRLLGSWNYARNTRPDFES